MARLRQQKDHAEPAEFIPLPVPLPKQPPTLTHLPTALTTRSPPPGPFLPIAREPRPSRFLLFLPGPFLPIAKEPRSPRFLLFLPVPFLPIAREPRPSHFLLFLPGPFLPIARSCSTRLGKHPQRHAESSFARVEADVEVSAISRTTTTNLDDIESESATDGGFHTTKTAVPTATTQRYGGGRVTASTTATHGDAAECWVKIRDRA
jgi:hypothetical protein